MMKRARFEPHHGTGFRGIKHLHEATIEERPNRGSAMSMYTVRFKGLDTGLTGEHVVHEVPVNFFIKQANTPNGEPLRNKAVIVAMTMQDTPGAHKPVASSPHIMHRSFGPKGADLFLKFHGYPQALVALGTFLRKRGVTSIMVPKGTTVAHDKQKFEMRIHEGALKRTYDQAAKALHLEEAGPEPDLVSGRSYWETNKYYKLDTDHLAHFDEHLKLE